MFVSKFAMSARALLPVSITVIGACSLTFGTPAAELGSAKIGVRLEPAAQTKAEPKKAEDEESEEKARQRSKKNLHQIVVAMYKFNDKYSHFPAFAVHDKDDKALLSWRVALLPFLDQEALFKEFKQNEPWDSEHNKRLLGQMPKVYAPTRGKHEENSTVYQVFTGKDMPFSGKRQPRYPESYTGGTANTILIVEAAEAVPWTKPADLAYDAAKPFPRLGGLFKDVFHAAFADGSVHALGRKYDEATMRKFITPNSRLDRNLIQIIATEKIAREEPLTTLEHDAAVYAVAFSPDGRKVLTGSGDPFADNAARLWETATGKPLATLKHDATVMAVAFSPDGLKVLTAGKTARLWEAASGKPLATLNHGATVNAVAFSPDGQQVLTGSDDRTARLWEAAGGKPLTTLRHEAAVVALRFSRDGRQILTGSKDKTARLWERASGKLLATLKHDGSVSAVAFSPDGRQVLTGSDDKTARLWESASGKLLGTLMHDDAVNTVAFSPDGRHLLTGSMDWTARLWEAAGGKLLTTLDHDAAVSAVAFSPDGRQLLTSSWDKTARLWEAAGGKRLATLSHDNIVWAVAFSPDGRNLLTGSEDTTARIWEVANGNKAGKKPVEPIDTVSGEDAAVALFKRMEQQVLKCKTLQVQLEISVEPGKDITLKDTLKGRLVVARDNRMRLDLDGTIKQEPGKMAIVSNGTKMRMTANSEPSEDLEMPSHLSEIGRAAVARTGVFVPHFLIAEPGKPGKDGVKRFLVALPFTREKEFTLSGLKLGKRETISGKEAHVLEYRLTTKPVEMPLATALWIDVKTNLPVKRVVTLRLFRQDWTVTETYVKVVLGEKIDVKEFELPKVDGYENKPKGK